MQTAAALFLAATLLLAGPGTGRAEGPEVQDFNFYNTDLHLVLKALAEVSGVSFVEDVPLSGKVTVHVAKRTGMDEVLEAILKPLGFTWRAVGTIYHVGLKAGERTAPGRPGYVQKTYPLKYISAGEASRQLRKFLRARGIVSVDRPMNQITVTIPPALLTDVENLIKAADVEVEKKLIAIRIKVLQIKKNPSGNPTYETGATVDYNKYNATMGLASQFTDTLNNYRGYGEGSSGVWTGGSNQGAADEVASRFSNAFTYKIGLWGVDQFVARIKLTAYSDDVKTVSEPDLEVLDGEKATVKIGEEIPFVNTGVSPAELQKYESSGIIITITPQTAKDGMISLDVDAASSPRSNVSDAAGPRLNNSAVKTNLTLVNGDTARLGGLLRQEEDVVINKIPILGDLPVIGILFRNEQTTIQRTELVLLVSPSIVEDVPPHGRRTAGISALVAWMIPGTTNVVLDWSEDVPVDNVGVFQYRIYRDIRPIVSVARLAPLADAVPRSMSTWVDESPKRRGVTYYYAVIAVDGAGNEQAVSNTPAITVPRR